MTPAAVARPRARGPVSAVGIALAALGAVACGGPGEETARPAVPAARSALLVILDTVRADHLSCYGYQRPTTPHLDALAREGERFDDAWSPSPWTLPAIATILTGRPPWEHGAGMGPEGLYPVRPEVPTLAEALRAGGLHTAAFVNVVFLGEPSGLDRGFDRYDFHSSDAGNVGTRRADATVDAALGWLDAQGDAPFFMVVHLFDPHLTYDPPPPYDTLFERPGGDRVPVGFGSAEQVFAIREGRLTLNEGFRESLVARYDGEIRYADEGIGRLREGLEARGRWKDTLVVVVADHGEEFWDHGGFEHGHSHHREILRVPLIVRRPGGPSGVVHEERARHADLAPTILAGLGLDPAGWPGRPLDGAGAALTVAAGSLWSGELTSVRSDEGTLILDRGTGAARFYAPGDTDERQDLGDAGPAARRLRALLAAVPERPAGPARELTNEEREALRALGYLR